MEIFEVPWSDLILAEKPKGPIEQFLEGTKLIMYWLATPWWASKSFINNKFIIINLSASGILIILWYFVLIVGLATFLVAATTDVEPNPQQTVATAKNPASEVIIPAISDQNVIIRGLSEYVRPVALQIASVATSGWFLILLAVLAWFPTLKLAGLASFVQKYLASGGTLKTDLHERIQQTVQRIYDYQESGKPYYDEVFVVGHSMGSVIALEALAGYGDARDRERTTLVTWGSPIEVLSRRSTELSASVEKACSGGIPRWFDVCGAKDWLCAPIRKQIAAYPGFLRKPIFPSWFSFERTHDHYFYDQETLGDLLAPGIPREFLRAGPETS